MQESFDFSAYARDVRRFSRSLMNSAGSGAEISGLVHLLTVAAERDLARFSGSQDCSRIACGPGCGASAGDARTKVLASVTRRRAVLRVQLTLCLVQKQPHPPNSVERVFDDRGEQLQVFREERLGNRVVQNK